MVVTESIVSKRIVTAKPCHYRGGAVINKSTAARYVQLALVLWSLLITAGGGVSFALIELFMQLCSKPPCKQRQLRVVHEASLACR